MSEFLRGKSILVVEDEFYLADDLALALTNAGVRVLGPFGTVDDAQGLVESGQAVDVAVLDIDLMGDRVFRLSGLLRRNGTPFLFATGYDPEVIPPEFRNAPRLEKPFTTLAMVELLEGLLNGSAPP